MSAGNPQGKGVVPVMDAWRAAQPATVQAKFPRQLLKDYFTGMLVLSAEFTFKPRRGVNYYLYLAGNSWRLSLIAPGEWGDHSPGVCLAQCELQDDMTWQLELEREVDDQPVLVEALRTFHDDFVNLLDQETTLEESLPYCVRELSYHRRVAAAGLASSLLQSLKLAGLAGNSAKSWLGGIPRISLVSPEDLPAQESEDALN